MAYKLRRGQIVRSHTGKSYVVKEFLGSGGQGEVYKANSGSSDYAVKWYYPHSATETQLELIKKLIAIGPPNDRFLWPLELLCDDRIKGFGYTMKLRDRNYKGIVDLM
ncbi:serine/threonine protein kinase, partial [Aduncisulcus paluster]